MKHFISVLVILLFTVANVDAQKFTPKASKSKSAISLKNHQGTVVIAGETFKGGKSSSGSIWIIRESSKSGKLYKSYLGTPTSHKYEGSTIFTANKAGEKIYYYFTINSKGFPKKNYLEVTK